MKQHKPASVRSLAFSDTPSVLLHPGLPLVSSAASGWPLYSKKVAPVSIGPGRLSGALLALQPHPENPIIIGARPSASVAVTRRHVQGPVRTGHDVPEPAIGPAQERDHPDNSAQVGGQGDLQQTLAPESRPGPIDTGAAFLL